MLEFDLRQRAITADQLLKVLEAGANITLTKVDECTLRIDASGSGGPSAGIKWHLKSGDTVTVLDCFEYFIGCNFIIDDGATMTIDEGGRLVIHEGPLQLDGVLTVDGIVKIGL